MVTKKFYFNKIGSLVGKFFLKVFGWKTVDMRDDIKKAVAIMAPHTSTWDIWLSLAAILASQTKLNWVGKSSLFNSPLGGLFRAIGGIPLNRDKVKDTVAAVCEEFKNRDEFIYGLAPEGSRGLKKRWRTGFYQIALKADVPVKFMFLDYRTKLCGCGLVMKMSGDIDKDLIAIREFYQTITPKNPKLYTPIRFSEAPQ